MKKEEPVKQTPASHFCRKCNEKQLYTDPADWFQSFPCDVCGEPLECYEQEYKK